MSDAVALKRRAAELGIETEYFDARGTHRIVGDDTLRRLAEALDNASAPTSIANTLIWRRGQPDPTIVAGVAEHARWRIVASGENFADGVLEIGGLRVPDRVPCGRYRLEFAGGEALHLVVSPAHAYQHDDGSAERLWVLAVQLYAVRSHRNWGHGDFTDLATLLRLAAKAGAAGVGVNPLHALFDDRPEQASPYSPNSRLFLNPLYIDIEAVAEFPGLEKSGLADQVARLRHPDQVDYTGVAVAKLAALRLAFDRFHRSRGKRRRAAFEAFRQERGEPLARFAAFEVLRRRFHDVWWRWPAPWQRADAHDIAALRAKSGREMAYFEYVQWIAEQQLAACQTEARALNLPIGLYVDLAVGVEPGGADAWSAQDSVIPQVEVGAPPDLLNTAGQAWGLAAFNPRRLETDGFAPFAELLAATMRHAGAIRLDHVLGLNRFYLIPFGLGAQDGAYVRYPLDGLLATVAAESEKHRCLVIGEDLGTVPDELRGILADWGVWSYLVMLFERRADGGFKHPHEYKRNALVTFNTHDLPSFAGWLSGHDLRVKHAIGLDPGETDQEREASRGRLRQVLDECRLSLGGEPRLVDVVKFLARAPSRLLALALDDIIGVAEQPNVPGTLREHPNWRRRLPVALEDLEHDPRLNAIAAALREEGRGV